MWKAKRLVKRHARHGDLDPTDLNSPALRRIAEGLRGVIRPVVDAMFPFMLGREHLTVELAYGVLRICSEHHPTRIVLVAVDGKLEQLGTLVIAW